MFREPMPTMARHALFVAVLLASTSGSKALAGDAAVLPGESRTTATRLAEVRKKIDDKKYVEAIDAWQAILESAGNDLVPLTWATLVRAATTVPPRTGEPASRGGAALNTAPASNRRPRNGFDRGDADK